MRIKPLLWLARAVAGATTLLAVDLVRALAAGGGFNTALEMADQALTIYLHVAGFLFLAFIWVTGIHFLHARGAASRSDFRSPHRYLLVLLLILFIAAVMPERGGRYTGGDEGVPRQLAGPLDLWKTKENATIGLTAPGSHDLLLTLHVLESHESAPPVLAVTADGKRQGNILTRPGGGLGADRWHTEGTGARYELFISSDPHVNNERKIVVETVEGSWIAIGEVAVKIYPGKWEAWRWSAEVDRYRLFWLALLLAVGSWMWLVLKTPGEGPKTVAMYAIMVTLTLLCGGALLGFMAAYVEFNLPWLTKDKESRRPADIFYSPQYVADPELGWRPRPNYRAYTTEVAGGAPSLFYANTRQGFRALAEEKETPATGGALLLGDSFTQGLFLRQEETIGAVISRRLGSAYVYNFGVGAYATDQEYTLYRRWIDQVASPWTILFFYANDLVFLDRADSHGFPKPRYHIVDGVVDFDRTDPLPAEALAKVKDQPGVFPDREMTYCCFKRRPASLPGRIMGRWGSYLQALIDPARLAEALTSDIGAIKATPPVTYLDTPEDILTNPKSFEPKLAIAFQFLVAMKKMTEKRNRKFLVVYLPDGRMIRAKGKGPLARLHDHFMEECARQGVACLDPAPALIDAAKMSDVHFLDDGHLSPYGAGRVGELVAERISSGR